MTPCKLSVTRLPHERYLLRQWYEVLVPGLPPRCSVEHLVLSRYNIKKSSIVHRLYSSRTVLNFYR